MTDLQRPKSMSELAYYTRRAIEHKGKKGKVELWVFKEKCDCGELPKKPKMRAKEYICKCGKICSVDEYEDKLMACIAYTCPACGNSGETKVPFKRKKVTIIKPKTGKKKRVDALVFTCDKCDFTINVTKKMK
ncbi:MAG: hypothetical protein KAQ81_05940 [Deltaproteobacteria bacterium]|nr:hypothetical protein [Deltaproteobacteria bacterium]